MTIETIDKLQGIILQVTGIGLMIFVIIGFVLGIIGIAFANILSIILLLLYAGLAIFMIVMGRIWNK